MTFSFTATIANPDELCRSIQAGTLVLCMSRRQTSWCLNRWSEWMAGRTDTTLVAERPQVFTLHDWLWSTTHNTPLNACQRADEAIQLWSYNASRAATWREKNLAQVQANLLATARRFGRICEEWQVPLEDPFWNNDGADLYRRWYNNASDLLATKGVINDNQLLKQLVTEPSSAPRLPQGRAILVGAVFMHPLLEKLLAAWQTQGSQIMQWQPDQAVKQEYELVTTSQGDTRMQVLRYAARRAYDLQRHNQRVLVVVPDLVSAWMQVFGVFWQHFAPQQNYSACMLDGARRFNLSGGLPLDQQPAVAAALGLLGLTRQTPMEQVIALLYNPIIDWSGQVSGSRSGLLAQLWQRVGSLTLHELTKARGRRLLPREMQSWYWPQQAVQSLADWPSNATPGTWSRLFVQHLRQCGWMHRVSQDSFDYQLLQEFTQQLENLARLDRLAQTLSHSAALEIFTDLLAGKLFQPQPTDSKLGQAPVQVLARLEAFGQQFDHSIICELDGASLTRMQQPDYPLPPMLQRQYKMPGSSPQKIQQDSELLWRGLAATAPSLTLCHAVGNETDNDAEATQNPFCTSSPELVNLPEIQPFGAVYSTEYSERARPLAKPQVTSSTVKAQSDCGWRGWWALHGLTMGSVALQRYPSASWRGQVLHYAMANLLSKDIDELHSSIAAAQANADKSLRELVATAVAESIAAHANQTPMLGRHTSASYVQFFTNVLLAWLHKHEAHTNPIACEQSYEQIALGQLTAGKIRIDRIDEITNQKVVIDYKTGTSQAALNLEDERISDPQLLLYVQALRQQGEKVAGLAYARLFPLYQSTLSLKGSELAFDYFAAGADKSKNSGRRKNALPESEWQQLLDDAIARLQARLNLYADGQVELDPIEEGKTVCRYCTLKVSCRKVAQQ